MTEVTKICYITIFKAVGLLELPHNLFQSDDSFSTASHCLSAPQVLCHATKFWGEIQEEQNNVVFTHKIMKIRCQDIQVENTAADHPSMRAQEPLFLMIKPQMKL